MKDKLNYSVRWTQAYGRVQSANWSKRQVVNSFVDELHSMQLDMIDEAVSNSDLKEANTLINYVKKK